MLRGIYMANTALVTQQVREGVIGQNLANLSTWGYKADRAVLRSFPEVLWWRLEGYRQAPIGTVGPGVAVEEVATDYRPGPLVFTGRPLDLALAGNGYFVVQDPSGGGYFFTRSGTFGPNAQGYLTNEQGYLVMGYAGPIEVGGGEAKVYQDGRVEVGGEERGRLMVVDFPPGQYPQKLEAGLFRAPQEARPLPVDTSIRSGYLEQANVDAVRTMVELLAAFRAYEAAQRVLRAQDETLGRAIEIGAWR
ncbi:MAG: flagellar hook-basal body protein [Moorellales bacterium]